jgi:hypothetical protein
MDTVNKLIICCGLHVDELILFQEILSTMSSVLQLQCHYAPSLRYIVSQKVSVGYTLIRSSATLSIFYTCSVYSHTSKLLVQWKISLLGFDVNLMFETSQTQKQSSRSWHWEKKTNEMRSHDFLIRKDASC